MKRQVAGVTHSVKYFSREAKISLRLKFVYYNQSFIIYLPLACMAHSKYMTGLVALLPVLSVAIIIPRPYAEAS